MPMFIFFVLHHVLAQEFLHLTCLPKSLPAVVLSRALLNSLSSQRQSCSLSAHHSGSQQTALLCQIVSHLTLQIDRTLLSRHLGLFLWIHSNLSPSVYWTWCWSQGITGRISLWCSIGHGPCSPRRSSDSCSDCIYYFLADWPFHGWILRSKWYYRWSSHIHSNSVSSREPLELNRLVLQGFFFFFFFWCNILWELEQIPGWGTCTWKMVTI